MPETTAATEADGRQSAEKIDGRRQCGTKNPSYVEMRIKRITLVTLLLVLGVGTLFYCFIYEEGRGTGFQRIQRGRGSRLFMDSISHTRQGKRSVIFLVSSKRSGSSFIGEYFNQHSELFYVFEPLQMLTFYVLEGKLNNSQFDSTALDVIQGLIDCRFDRGFRSPEEWLTRKSPLCVFSQLVGQSSMCSDPLSYNSSLYNASEVGNRLRDICLTKPTIVFKLIRIQDLEFLKPFILNRTLDVKVLYLVRDPRGTINSRSLPGYEENFDLLRRELNSSVEIDDACDTMETNLRYWLETPSWLKGRLKVIRYEDVALHPLALGNEIFRFVDQNFDMKVIEWLFWNTRNSQTEESLKGKGFETSRDSAERVDGWRKEMVWERVSFIQSRCHKVMGLLGYLPIPSEQLLVNSSMPSITPYDALL